MTPSLVVLLAAVSVHGRSLLAHSLAGLPLTAVAVDGPMAAERELQHQTGEAVVVIDSGLLVDPDESAKWTAFRRRHGSVSFVIRSLISPGSSPQADGARDWIVHPGDVDGLRTLLTRLTPSDRSRSRRPGDGDVEHLHTEASSELRG